MWRFSTETIVSTNSSSSCFNSNSSALLKSVCSKKPMLTALIFCFSFGSLIPHMYTLYTTRQSYGYLLEVGLARSLWGFGRMSTISSCKASRQEILQEMVLHDSRMKNHCMFLQDQSCKPYSDISRVNHARPLPPNKCKSV
jgi:hypothetical protein